MPTWQDRLKQAQHAARQGARQAAVVAGEVREKAEPALREAVEKAKPAVERGARRSRAAVDATLEERRAQNEARVNWYLTEDGPIHTAGYSDQEKMRAGIQVAAEHGWRVESTATVPGPPRIPGGIATMVAKQAAERVLKPDKFMVTFRKGPRAAPPTPAPGAAPDRPAGSS